MKHRIDEATAAAATPPAIDARSSWLQALRWGFGAAIGAGARRIICVDPDFAHWPLNDATLHGALGAWLRLPQRRLVLLAAHFDELRRQHPRFVVWRRDWVHAVSAFAAPEELAGSLPSRLVCDAQVSVQLFDAVHWRGRADRDPRSAHLLQVETEASLQHASPAMAVNVLGL